MSRLVELSLGGSSWRRTSIEFCLNSVRLISLLAIFYVTADAANVPAAFTLQEVRDSIGALETLKTAELERLFAEHLTSVRTGWMPGKRHSLRSGSNDSIFCVGHR